MLLRTDNIALYYLHSVDPETPLEESLAAVEEYRDRGKIRHIGVSEVPASRHLPPRPPFMVRLSARTSRAGGLSVAKPAFRTGHRSPQTREGPRSMCMKPERGQRSQRT